MFAFIIRCIRASFLLFLFMVIAPTFIFLTRWYYTHLISHKTYVGVISLPLCIEKSEEIITSAKTLFSSHEIKGIIIQCNGHGGNVGACQAIYSDLMRLKELYKKPLIAYCERECFAGAYAIATAADVIIATPGALIGHIGDFICHETHEITYPKEENIRLEYENQYFEMITKSRKKIDVACLQDIRKNIITGKKAKERNLVDFIGGTLEIDRVMRSKTVIEGSLEEVHGSLAAHFINSTSDIINRIIRGIKK
jgi:ClpP class serine protease